MQSELCVFGVEYNICYKRYHVEVVSKFIPINGWVHLSPFFLERLLLSILHVVIDVFCGDVCVNQSFDLSPKPQGAAEQWE